MNRMDRKVEILVYGIYDQAVGIGKCGSSCVPASTMGELYNRLVDYLSVSDMKEHIDIRFVDIFQGSNGFVQVEDLMDRGYNLPITVIGQTTYFHSWIYNEDVYKAVKETMENL